jgi:hypothetical protein
MAAGKSAGRADRMLLIALIPPKEAAIATTSKAGLEESVRSADSWFVFTSFLFRDLSHFYVRQRT